MSDNDAGGSERPKHRCFNCNKEVSEDEVEHYHSINGTPRCPNCVTSPLHPNVCRSLHTDGDTDD